MVENRREPDAGRNRPWSLWGNEKTCQDYEYRTFISNFALRPILFWETGKFKWPTERAMPQKGLAAG